VLDERMKKQTFHLIGTEMQYKPVMGRFKYGIQGKNLANMKAFTSLNINEISSSTYSASMFGRCIIFNISMSIK